MPPKPEEPVEMLPVPLDEIPLHSTEYDEQQDVLTLRFDIPVPTTSLMTGSVSELAKPWEILHKIATIETYFGHRRIREALIGQHPPNSPEAIGDIKLWISGVIERLDRVKERHPLLQQLATTTITEIQIHGLMRAELGIPTIKALAQTPEGKDGEISFEAWIAGELSLQEVRQLTHPSDNITRDAYESITQIVLLANLSANILAILNQDLQVQAFLHQRFQQPGERWLGKPPNHCQTP